MGYKKDTGKKWFNANQLIKFSKYERLFAVLIHFQPMLHLWINQVVGFYQQNVTLPHVLFTHVPGKNHPLA